ncbi:GNAT family N-acetyltransferase [Bacillus sp. 03113]|uniref:GNAT family N-acetyltransferase n=1 Tax=Bacillus sp. 03113 TaxID=2578211 RepID=UPI00114489FE|nr:GNAT family protein [Bacillus sp. 03113]
MIRKIQLSDAYSFLQLCKQLDRESKFMMYEPEERKATEDQQKNFIDSLLKEDQSIIFVCEVNGQLVGHLTAIRQNLHRIQHSAYIVIGILKEFTGKGNGTKLFEQLEQWVFSKKLHRLELTVMAHNKAAIALYKKMGFEIEGTKKHSLVVDGQFVDEYYMAKLL